MKKMEKTFSTGDIVVYPSHGIARIESVEKKSIMGSEIDFFSLSFESKGIRVFVPVDRSETSGMRHVSSKESILKALDVLKKRAKKKTAIWARHAQEQEKKISSGDIILIAEVVRDLWKGGDGQSYSERMLHEKAMARLSEEISVALGTHPIDAMAMIEKNLS